MQNKLIASIALACTMMLSGCIIVTDHEWDEDGHESWAERQRDNQAYIADLRVGIPLEHVRTDLGSPDFSESYTDDRGRQVLILWYRTHHRHSDGETTRDETTPLVFVTGELVGWGEKALPEGNIAGNY